eukprot:Stramenopile-MAST_4_protein_1035
MSRWIALVLISLFMSCVYYAFDNPAALHDQLRDHFHHLSANEFEYQFNMLYTAYSLPNVILPFFGGLFVDRYGAENCCLVFLVILGVGQVVVAIGVTIRSFPVMLLGRAVYGIGGESVMVASSTLLQAWFRHGEIALAMGLSLSVSRLGSVSNNIVSPWLAENSKQLKVPFFFSACVLGVSIVAAAIIKVLGARADRKIKEDGYDLVEDDEDERERQATAGKGLCEEMAKAKSFSTAYWLMTVSCVVVYGTVLPFNNVASALIIEKFICGGPCCGPHLKQCHRAVSAESTASYVMGIPFTVSAFLTPVVGVVVDYCGGNAMVTTLASLILVGVHATIRLSHTVPYWPLFFQGVAYSMYAAALWPAIGDSVRRVDAGMAYGLTTAFQNIGLASLPLAVASLRASGGDYDKVEILFISLSTVGVVVGTVLSTMTWWGGGSLKYAVPEEEDEEDAEIRREKALEEARDLMEAEGLRASVRHDHNAIN